MDGRLITEMRTGAVSAVATQHLARADASVLGILGAGVQARSHLEAMRLVRKFREVRVWSPRNAGAFAAQFGVRAAASVSARSAIADRTVSSIKSHALVISPARYTPSGFMMLTIVARPRPRKRPLV